MRTYRKRRQRYPSDLSDQQWAEIAPLFSGMRVYKWSKKELLDTVLDVKTTGCQWRQLPHDFPPYTTVQSFFRRAKLSGLWARILDHLVRLTRKNTGRKETPSYAIIDSQSVKNNRCQWWSRDWRGKDDRAETAYCSRCHGKFIGCRCTCSQYTWYKIRNSGS